MGALAYNVNIKRGNLDVFLHTVVVDTHDGAPVSIDLLLVAIGGLGNLTLEETILDAGQHAAQRIDTIEIIHRRLLGLVGQALDEVGAAQGVNGVDNATFTGDDLLRAQSNQSSLLGGQRQCLNQGVCMQRIGAAQHGSQGLNGGAHNVVIRLLSS